MNCKYQKNKNNPVKSLKKYLKAKGRMMGAKVIYSSLLMFFAYQNPDTPKWAKTIILGALAYLVSPIDGIPDLTPLLGFTDDLGVLLYAIVGVSCYINDDIRHKSREKTMQILGDVHHAVFTQVDEIL